eukprot:TRINITY_DN3424_c0_g1_i1.p1 TRINITY_DN3424_c0_g1~~TRINITY_DN3424_c0_g1_i1.p1  ORF type:complete len:424 (-),score=107.86 TRINITY_DN3424_c0_g1_i1:40-1311(-)
MTRAQPSFAACRFGLFLVFLLVCLARETCWLGSPGRPGQWSRNRPRPLVALATGLGWQEHAAAGDEAAKHGRHADACRRYEEALAEVSGSSESSAMQAAFDLLVKIGDAQMNCSELVPALARYKEAHVLLRKQHSELGSAAHSTRTAQLYMKIGAAFGELNDLPNALRTLRAAQQALEASSSSSSSSEGDASSPGGGLQSKLGAQCLQDLGDLLTADGDYKLALETYEEAMEVREEIGEMGTQEAASLLSNLGALHAQAERPEKALDMLQEAHRIFTNEGLLWSADGASLLVNLAAAQEECQQTKQALASLLQAQDIMESQGQLETEDGAFLLCALGRLHEQVGDKEYALEALTKAGQLLEEQGKLDSEEGAAVLMGAGRLYAEFGDEEASKMMYESLNELVKQGIIDPMSLDDSALDALGEI